MAEEVWQAFQDAITIECGTESAIMSTSKVTFDNITLFGKDSPCRSWPKSTHIACFHCTEPFAGPPMSIPVAYDSKTERWTMDGVFCSCQCALAHLCDTKHHHFLYGNMMCWTKLFAQVYLGVKNARRAPKRRLLQKFGGNMTIEEFRNHKQDHVTYQIQKQPFFSFQRTSCLAVSRQAHNETFLGQTHGIGIARGTADEKSRYLKFLEKQQSDTEKKTLSIVGKNH